MQRAWLMPMMFVLFLTGCTVSKSAWTPEQCNRRLASDAEALEEFQVQVSELEKELQAYERRGEGGAPRAVAYRESVERGKGNIRTKLDYVDNELTDDCGKDALDPALMARVEAARAYLAAAGGLRARAAEGMPNVRVTDISSQFIPFEETESGSCAGPYLGLTLKVTNEGADFPRSIDLETTLARTKDPHETLRYLVINYDFDYGDGYAKPSSNALFRNQFAEGVMKAGASIDIPIKLKVEDNQSRVRVRARVKGGYFLEAGSDDFTYETDYIDIPIWDVDTAGVHSKEYQDQDNWKYMKISAEIINRGKTATPGPVKVHYQIHKTEDDPAVLIWDGRTEGPIGPGGTAVFNGEAKTFRTELGDQVALRQYLTPLCPDGKGGGLSDGKRDDTLGFLHAAVEREETEE